MSASARAVLRDCEAALAEWQGTLDADVRRRRWVALVALLRAVGHVLAREGRDTSDGALRSAIEEAWRRPKPSIYTSFIEAERNNVLKAYTFTPIQTGLEVRVREEEVEIQVPNGGTVHLRRPWADVHERIMFVEGPFQGADPVVVLNAAIAFWVSYLDDIDREVQALRQTER